MSGKPGVMVYFDLLPAMEGLSNVDKGVLFEAILRYGQRLENPKLTKRTQLLWPMIRQRLDSDNQRYFLTVRRREYAAYVRWTRRNGTEPKDFIGWLEENGYHVENETYYAAAEDRYNAQCKALDQKAKDLYSKDDTEEMHVQSFAFAECQKQSQLHSQFQQTENTFNFSKQITPSFPAGR